MRRLREIASKCVDVVHAHLGLAILLTAVLGGLLLLSNRYNVIGNGQQWDFRVHYYSSQADKVGLNPYNNEAVNRVNRTKYVIPGAHTYAYHPYTLHFFRLFEKPTFEQSEEMYMFFTVILIFLLVTLWGKRFCGDTVNVGLFILLLFFAFDRTLLVALICGNPAVLESLLVWLAFWFYCRDSRILFLIPLLVISLFKGTPIVLAGMLLFGPGRAKNLKLLLIALSLFFSVWLSPLYSCPAKFHDYWNFASNVKELGSINPCSASLILDWLEKMGQADRKLFLYIYLHWVAVVGLVYLWVVQKLDFNKDRMLLVFLTILSYAIVAPRFKTYAYIQLIPVAYSLAVRNPALLLADLFSFFTADLRMPYFIRDYAAFYAALINWAYLVYWLSFARNREKGAMLLPAAGEVATSYGPFLKSVRVLSVGLAVSVVSLLAYKEMARVHQYVLNREKRIEISGVPAECITCGAFEIMMNMDFYGHPIEINGRKYSVGIVAHAASNMDFRLKKRFEVFQGMVGMMDTSLRYGKVRFIVKGDGRVLFASREVMSGQEPIPVTVVVKDVNVLSLVVDPLGDNGYDHAVWLNPVFSGKY